MLTTDRGDSGHPDLASITAALLDVYRSGSEIGRFVFYFAGHGLLAFSDGARTQAVDLLLAADVPSVEDGSRMLNLGEVLNYLRLTGPREQFYFVDACRDLNYERQPGIPSLAWAQQDQDAARAQGVLHAVSPQGRALGTPNGFGAMTTALAGALRGEGRATEFAVGIGYHVTLESVHARVSGVLRPRLEEQLEWRRKFMEPELHRHGPPLDPLRLIEDPSSRRVAVHVQPDDAAPRTAVRLGLGDGDVQWSWPPVPNHEAVELRPRLHELLANSTAGDADPTRSVVDPRETAEVTVRVRTDGHVQATSEVTVEAPERLSPVEDGKSTLEVAVPDGLPLVVEARGLEPPYARRRDLGGLRARVPPGVYAVLFRNGPEVADRREVLVAPGAVVRVTASAQLALVWTDHEPYLTQVSAHHTFGGVPLTVAAGTGSADSEITVMLSIPGYEWRGDVVQEPGRPLLTFFTTVPDEPFDIWLVGDALGEIRIPGHASRHHESFVMVRFVDGLPRVTQSRFEYAGSRWSSALRSHALARELAEFEDLAGFDMAREAVLEVAHQDPLIASLAAYNLGPAADAELRDQLEDWEEDVDAQVALAYLDADRKPSLSPLLARGVVPVLSAGVGLLARHAEDTGWSDHPIVERAAHLRAGNAFAMEWRW